VHRRLFWPLIALASVSLALAGGSFATALYSDPLPRGFASYAPADPSATDKLGRSEPEIIHVFWGREAFGRATSLDWSSDREFLVATILFGAFGIATFLVVARLR
jgi:hypothetical protein